MRAARPIDDFRLFVDQENMSQTDLLPRPRAGGFARCAAAVLIAASLLAACSPQFDWREIRGSDEPYSAMLPGKPSTFSRSVNLNGTAVTMQMTAADVSGVTFAIGSASLPDPAAAEKAIGDMKTALVRNINGTILRETANTAAGQGSTLEVEARGSVQADGQPRLLIGRFVARDRRVYQAIVLGKEKAVSREAADTFLTSFKPE